MVQSLVSYVYLPCDFFFFNVVLTLPYLCKYLAYIVSKGVSWKDTKIVGSLFFFFYNFSCAKQHITSVQNFSGSVTSNAIL